MSTVRSEARNRRLYVRAGIIMKAAMGPAKRGGWQCDEDPLAYWAGIFAIVDLFRPTQSTEGPPSSTNGGRENG